MLYLFVYYTIILSKGIELIIPLSTEEWALFLHLREVFFFGTATIFSGKSCSKSLQLKKKRQITCRRSKFQNLFLHGHLRGT